MLEIAGLTFLSPLSLGFLASLPVLWWLLRFFPPSPRVVQLPSFFLLNGLTSNITTPARTPWWLLVLRGLTVILFVLAFSSPVLNKQNTVPAGTGDVLIVIENGWPAASHWQERIEKMREMLAEIKRQKRSVTILPTAASVSDAKIPVYGPMQAAQAEGLLRSLEPQSWAPDFGDTQKYFQDLTTSKQFSQIIYFDDGVKKSGSDDFIDALSKYSSAFMVVTDDKINTPYILRHAAPARDKKTLSLSVEKLTTNAPDTSIVAYDENGVLLDEYVLKFASNNLQIDIEWAPLADIAPKIARLALKSVSMASATILNNPPARQKPVGIISDATQETSSDFLSETYYLEKSFDDNGNVYVDTLDHLMERKVSALIWPDSTPLTAVERVSLLEWVQNGGFLIRFSGPNLAANPEDPLLPIHLRYGERSMGGAMTWEKPQKLGDIAKESPLTGLTVPDDVAVSRQILATPDPDTFEKTWLQLEDGSPLITGGKIQSGTVVLVHTSAGPDWSNFCYSGLYVETLKRFVLLSNGINDYKPKNALPPLMIMDGFGHLKTPPNKNLISSLNSQQTKTPSARIPPGIYGDAVEAVAFNLGDNLPSLQQKTSWPQKAQIISYSKSNELNFKAALFTLAVLFLFIDTIITIIMRGILTLPLRWRRAISLSLLMFAVLLPSTAFAETPQRQELATGIYLAYVETGDSEADNLSYNGLSGLADMIKVRTTIKIKGVVGVDPSSDDLYFYPFIYWPMTSSATGLSATAARNIQNYMAQGGIVVFDTRDQDRFNNSGPLPVGTQRLRALTQVIQVRELVPVPDQHILTKSFYLLDQFPGRFPDGKVWVEQEPDPNHDSISSVVVGSNDWATAWSSDGADRARYDILPGGERQREMAYRFGINLTMMALAGSYKSDQVHIPYILERIGR